MTPHRKVIEVYMERLHPIIARAQEEFAALLSRSIGDGSISLRVYQRYLSMQYHLARGVQRYFIVGAAHSSLARRRSLRRFLFEFANEEELHYLVAANDLLKLGLGLLPEPFDVTLWHSYFEKTIVDRPFVRLGAACILENISAGPARGPVKAALSAPFLNRSNTKFLVLHQHETVPHGQQIIEALSQASLEPNQIEDLVQGARQGMVMYLRMAEWALSPDCISSLADPDTFTVDAMEKAAIDAFCMEELSEG
jgi:hypothetical protein